MLLVNQFEFFVSWFTFLKLACLTCLQRAEEYFMLKNLLNKFTEEQGEPAPQLSILPT